MGYIEAIWDEFSGVGVSVGVYDDGIDYNHVDLNDNYDSSLHVLDGGGTAVDPFPVGNNAHGTASAGLIGAESDNGTGGTGVASGVTLTGVNIFNSGIYGYINAADSSGFLDVAGQAAANFDISSNSWGSTPNFGSNQNISVSSSFAGELDAVHSTLSSTGRGGLGTIVTQAAGNDDLDANGSGTNASRFTITVAAADEFGDIQGYSNHGSSILVTAPSGSVTTDISGSAGYTSSGYRATFGGTSASTPVTSGVIALMLEANDRFNTNVFGEDGDLGWRDVQNILAISASEAGSGYGNAATGFEVSDWGYNSATNWNGGAMAISGSYGYGIVDAYAATRMAEIWSLFDEAQTSANEATVSETEFTGLTTIPDGSAAGADFTVTVAGDIEIEHVALSLSFNTTYVGDVEITITTPDGTVIDVFRNEGFGNQSFNGTWTFGVDHLRGETSAGDWIVNVADVAGGDTLTVTGITLDIFGQTIDTNDVYHYTNDFLTLANLDASRLNLEDTNGGTDDWLNLAATGTADSAASLNLTTGVAVTNGTTLQLLSATNGIEHVVGGDSNETDRRIGRQ